MITCGDGRVKTELLINKIFKDILTECYFSEPRRVFEFIYLHKDLCKELKPEFSDLIDKLCEAKSENDFLRTLYLAGIKSDNIAIDCKDDRYFLV